MTIRAYWLTPFNAQTPSVYAGGVFFLKPLSAGSEVTDRSGLLAGGLTFFTSAL